MRSIAIIALVAVIGFTMAACSGGGGGKLSGAYTDEDNLTYTFTGNKVTYSQGDKVYSELMFETSGNELIFYNEANGERFEEKMIFSLEGDKLTLSIPGHPELAVVYIKQKK